MDITLSDGKQIALNFKTFTRREFQEMFEKKNGEKKTDEVISRAAGMTVDELLDLNFEDSRRIVEAFWKKCREPLADPNSESASF